jgi:hypothetical protein
MIYPKISQRRSVGTSDYSLLQSILISFAGGGNRAAEAEVKAI